MISHSIFSSSCEKSPPEVERVSTVSLFVLNDEIAKSLSQKYPDLTVNLAQNVSVDGVNFRNGIDLLVDCLILAKLCRYVFLKDGLAFIVKKKMNLWYREHYRSFSKFL